MRKLWIAIVGVAVLRVLASSSLTGAQDSGWILTNVKIVSLERGRMFEARTLDIRDDRIAAIVESATAGQVAGRARSTGRAAS